jgi:hypothetical protein
MKVTCVPGDRCHEFGRLDHGSFALGYSLSWAS